VATNTTLAACSGGLFAMFWAFPQTKKWDLGFTVNGFLAGLVAITCPCYWVTPTGAILIGAVGGVVVVLGVNFLEWLRIDDPIGAVPVHGFCGIWGTLSLGLFAAGSFGAATSLGSDPAATRLAGLFYGGGLTLLKAQMIGSAIVTLATFAGAMGLMYLVKALGVLRVSKEGELMGLDVHEHGIPAYPEFVLHESPSAHGSAEASAVAHPSAMPTTQVEGKTVTT
jgi:ammonium transporter, Amt family